MPTSLERSTCHALIVGIGEYQVQRMNVPQVVADARGVAGALVEAGAYTPQQVSLLTGIQATRPALIAALRALAARTSADSTVFLFLSSHGQLGEDFEYSVVTADSTFTPAGLVQLGTGLSAPELIDLLRAIPAQKLLCIINTCFSGHVGAQMSGALAPDAAQEGAQLLAQLKPALGQGRVLITASRAQQASHYALQSPHTYFGQALIDGLRGKGVPSRSGYIGLYELYEHLYAQTSDATGQLQEPMLSVVEGVGPFPITRHPQPHAGDSGGSIQQEPPSNMAVELLRSQLDQAFAPDRARLLTHMRESWVTQVLDRGLYTLSPLRPTLVDTPDSQAQPLDMTLERYRRPPQPLPPDSSILKVFNACGGQLLIRGEPGGGKTTLLLELARDLITYAEHEPLAPLPVVLLLRWWADKRLPFADWLIDQLCMVYRVSRQQAGEWVAQDRLVLLLDALDDVPVQARDACVSALNAFLATHSSVRVVLCSQTDAYERLSERPNLVGGSIMIRPLTKEQIDTYLADEQLRGVREAIARSDELGRLARLPLMLNLISIAYANQAAVPTPANDTAEAWSQQLFDAYVSQRLGQARGAQPYPPEQTITWLAWLARCLVTKQQVGFYIDRFDQLELTDDDTTHQQQARPFDATTIQQDWLPTQRLRRIYRGSAGFFFGGALSAVLFVVWINQLGWAGAALVVLGVAAFFGLLAALLPQLSVAVTQVRVLTVAEAFGPSLHRGARPGLVLVVGLCTFVGWLGGQTLLGFAAGCLVALIVGAFFFMAVTLARVVARRITSPRMGAMQRQLVFVLSIFAGGILSGVICGLPAGLVLGGLLGEPRIGAISGPLTGVLVGFIFSLMQSIEVGGLSFLNHYVLRWLLARSGAAPWDLPGFLHYTAGLTLIYRVGDGYMFIHRRMQDHLAQLHKP